MIDNEHRRQSREAVERRAREAEALRANLARRKAQARARVAGTDGIQDGLEKRREDDQETV